MMEDVNHSSDQGSGLTWANRLVGKSCWKTDVGDEGCESKLRQRRKDDVGSCGFRIGGNII